MVSIINGNRFGYLKDITSNPSEVITEKSKYLDFGIRRQITLNCNNNNCYKIHAQSYAQSANGRFKTHEFNVNIIATPLFGYLTGTIPFVPVVKYNLPENGMSYDVAPGARLRINPFEDIEKPTTVKWINFTSGILTGIASGTFAVSKNNVKLLNFIPSYSSTGYIAQPNEPRNIYKSFAGVNLSRCAGTTVFDTVYAFNTDMLHVDIDQNIANAFRNEVYNLKTRPVCANECVETIVKAENILSNPTELVASKSILLNPNFKVENGKVFIARIGCNSNSNFLSKQQNNFSNSTILTTCSIEWDTPNNSVNCGLGFTKFNLSAKYIESDSYAEFSINNSTWFRANLGNKNYSLFLNSNPGQPQTFYARDKNKPLEVITINLSHCN